MEPAAPRPGSPASRKQVAERILASYRDDSGASLANDGATDAATSWPAASSAFAPVSAHMDQGNGGDMADDGREYAARHMLLIPTLSSGNASPRSLESHSPRHSPLSPLHSPRHSPPLRGNSPHWPARRSPTPRATRRTPAFSEDVLSRTSPLPCDPSVYHECEHSYRSDSYRADSYSGDSYRADSYRGDSYRGDSPFPEMLHPSDGSGAFQRNGIHQGPSREWSLADVCDQCGSSCPDLSSKNERVRFGRRLFPLVVAAALLICIFGIMKLGSSTRLSTSSVRTVGLRPARLDSSKGYSEMPPSSSYGVGATLPTASRIEITNSAPTSTPTSAPTTPSTHRSTSTAALFNDPYAHLTVQQQREAKVSPRFFFDENGKSRRIRKRHFVAYNHPTLDRQARRAENVTMPSAGGGGWTSVGAAVRQSAGAQSAGGGLRQSAGAQKAGWGLDQRGGGVGKLPLGTGTGTMPNSRTASLVERRSSPPAATHAAAAAATRPEAPSADGTPPEQKEQTSHGGSDGARLPRRIRKRFKGQRFKGRKFLFPLLDQGPNNQYLQFRVALAKAHSLNRTLVLPLWLPHNPKFLHLHPGAPLTPSRDMKLMRLSFPFNETYDTQGLSKYVRTIDLPTFRALSKGKLDVCLSHREGFESYLRHSDLSCNGHSDADP